MSKLTSKAEFARVAGVTHAAITKAIKHSLGVAMVGKRIDMEHPAALDYVQAQQAKAVDIDPLYDQVVEWCAGNKRYSISKIQRYFKIGYNRATRIVESMKSNGITPESVSSFRYDVKPYMREIIKCVQVPPPPPSQGAGTQASAPPPPVVLKGYGAKNAAAKKAPPAPSQYDLDKMLTEIPDDIRAFADMSLRELVIRFGTDVRFVDWLKATKTIEDINEKRLKNAETKGELVSRALVRKNIIEPFEQAHIKLLTDGAKTITVRVVAMSKADRSGDDIEKFVIDQIGSFIRPVKAKVKRALSYG